MAKQKFNHQWYRVIATTPSKDELMRMKRNRSTLKNKQFVDACARVDTPVTTRQASKWNNKKGSAYKSVSA